jgi:cellulase/cellobiase CelA1
MDGSTNSKARRSGLPHIQPLVETKGLDRTVQTILGHKHVDTTLAYARLYEGTVAADYYRAMAQVESRFNAPETSAPAAISSGQLLALVDALSSGTLNAKQQALVQALRAAVLALPSQASEAPRAPTRDRVQYLPPIEPLLT